MVVDPDERRVLDLELREPVENLDELELVVEVGLVPEHELFVRRGLLQDPIALRQVRERLLVLRPARVGKEAGASLAKLLVGEAGRDGALVQHVTPREHVSVDS